MKSFLIFIFVVSTVLCESGSKFRKEFSEEQIQSAKKYFEQLDDYDRNSWIDPNDMLASSSVDDDMLEPATSTEVDENVETKVAYTEEPTPPEKHNAVNSSSSDPRFPPTNVSTDSVYLKRWLKMLLSTVRVNDDSNKVISFPLSNKTLKRVEKLLTSENPNYNIVEDALSDILSKATVSEETSWLSRNMDIILGKEVVICVPVFLILLSVYLVCKDHPKVFGCAIVLLLSIGVQWMQLYKEKLAIKHGRMEKINFDAACRIKDAGVVDALTLWLKSAFVSHGSCEEYYKALMVDPIWEVTPLMAISATASKFILYPLETLAETVNNCMVKLFKDLPLLNTLILILFMALLLMMYCNYRIRLPFFFSFEPGAPHQPQIQHIASMPQAIHYVVDTHASSLPLSVNNTITSCSSPLDTSCKQASSMQRTEALLSSQINHIVSTAQETVSSGLSRAFNNLSISDNVKHINNAQIVNTNGQKMLCEKGDFDNGKNIGITNKVIPEVKNEVNAECKTEVSIECKNEVNAGCNNQVKVDDKNKVSTDCKREVNADSKCEVNTDCKREVNTDCKHEVNADCKHEVNSDCKHEVNSDCKHEVNSDCKHEVNSDCKHEVNSDCKREVNMDCKHQIMDTDCKAEVNTEFKSEVDINFKNGTNANHNSISNGVGNELSVIYENDQVNANFENDEVDMDFENQVYTDFENEVGVDFENEIDVDLDYEDEVDVDFETELELCNESIETCLASLNLDVSPDLKLETPTPTATPVPEDKELSVT